MTAPACAHLHVHSEYSLLDGAAKIDALAKRAAAFGQPALGLTDHGVMNGAIEHFLACRKHGIKPISGCEIYLVDDHANRAPGKVERNHLTLLAASDEGFANLVKLSSAGFLEGLHRGKPSLDMAQLHAHSEGIIALTGCLASRFCQRLIDDNPAEARAHADDLMEVFGRDNVYFEVQKNGIDVQDKANAGIVKIAREVGRPLVGTGDVHYLGREDYHHHAALLCVQTKSTLAAPSMSFDTNEFFLKSNEEMATDFAEWPEALASTVEIAERCELDIELDKQLIPRFLAEEHDEGEYLRERVLHGLRERFGDPVPAAAAERMEMELGVIAKMGFDAYFLIVWDFVKWAKDNGIAVGPGRGSAAGSLVAYALRITDLDPLHHGLLFERFLNPERVSMPDIDIDFSVKGRERVMQYVVGKYGRESVAQIITFGKMLPRAATKDAARVLGHDYGVGDRLAKLIPDPEQGRSPSFDDCLKAGADLRKEYDSDPTAKQIIDVARGLEGIVRNNSIHAAAVVIAGMPLTDVVPLQLADARSLDADGNKVYKMVTQYSMKPIEMLGLLKMDFLGLRNLDVIEAALDIIERSSGARPDMDTLPMDDAATYEMLARGDSVGVFQFESEGMQGALRQVKPTEFNDLVALVALYRPGAMDQIPTYARGKKSPDNVEIPDERLESIIGGTYGVILYQEQAMQISKSLAGFSGAMADDLRKAIGKKNRDAMAKLEPEFRAGCERSGTARGVVDWLWETNKKSADYSFNKCLSASTRVIAADGERMRLSEAHRRGITEVMSMWADGEVRPHAVQRIVKTGRKPVFRVRCESGRQLKATAEHRLLSTEGYLPVEQLSVGMELITTPMTAEEQREARRQTMTRLAASPARRGWDRAASMRQRARQAARPAEDKAAHMRRMHGLHPEMTRAGTAALHERVKWLWANDPEWRKAQLERTFARVRDAYDTGPGYGHCSIASNGMWCASRPEREMCEWLVSQGVDFEMHKVLDSGRICDFYFDGVYWEMDGMDRSPEYFSEKYGELPYVVVAPEDFRFRVERHLATAHVENGDPIVSIEYVGLESTYDIEMAADGPLNFLADGIVSHNSHAACYALISYRTAWLKANHCAEYMAALISSVMDTKDKVPFFAAKCEEMGIGVLPPDVNLSDHEFVVVDGDIRFGLDAVKGLGHAAVEAIKAAREEGGAFTSLWDFCARVDPRCANKKAIEALVKCGAFSSTGDSRKGMLSVLEQAQAAGQKTQQDAEIGQGSIFDMLDAPGVEPAAAGGSAAAFAPSYPPIPPEEFEQGELLAIEKEAIGLFLSAHPLKEVREALYAKVDCRLAKLADRKGGDWVTAGGIITQAKKIRTKSGDPMMFATLDDLEGSVEILVFAKTLAEFEPRVDDVLIVRGRVDHGDKGTVLVAQQVDPFTPTEAEVDRAREEAAKAPQVPDALRLRADARRLPAAVIDDLKHLFLQHPGGAEVVLELDTSDGRRFLLFGPGFKVKPSADLRIELDAILGPALPVEPLEAAAIAAGAPIAGPDDELPVAPAVTEAPEPSMA